MMELQAHHQGNMPGIQLYGSRCNPYTFPITRIPRPMFLDSLHSRQNNGFSREKLQAWASGHKSNIEGHTVQPTSRSNKPYVTWAAFPNDIPRLVEIEFAAFRDEIVNHQLSYRDGSNPEHTSRTIDFYTHCMQHMRHNALPGHVISHDDNDNNKTDTRSDSKLDLSLPAGLSKIDPSSTQGYRFRKVLDPQTNEIIAFAKSEITTLTPKDHASPLDVGHESEPEMNRAWFALNEKLHRAYCGQRQHLYFGMLATHPSHQHRGAASALMTELVAEADALDLEIYCEATKTGRPLYEKYGFVAVETLRFDPSEYGVFGLGVETQTVMIRGRVGEDGVRRVGEWEV